MEDVTLTTLYVCEDRETGEECELPEPKEGSVHPNGQPAPAAPPNTSGMVVPKTSPEASGASNSAPTIEPIEGEGDWWEENKSDAAHAALDAAGMIPGIGIFADAANAIFYAVQGDLKTAGVSVLAMIPVAGQGVTAAKYGAKAAETAVEAGAKAKAKQEAAEAAARKADAPSPSKPPKKDKDTEEPKEGEGKDGGYVEGSGKGADSELTLGGRHRDTKKDGKKHGTESHHPIADDASDIATDDAPAIRMKKEDHVYRTGNWGSRKSSKRFRAEQKALVAEGRYDEAFKMGIDDIKLQNPNVYDEHIDQMLDSMPKNSNGSIDWGKFKRKK